VELDPKALVTLEDLSDSGDVLHLADLIRQYREMNATGPQRPDPLPVGPVSKH
jgi:hypothetical protein